MDLISVEIIDIDIDQCNRSAVACTESRHGLLAEKHTMAAAPKVFQFKLVLLGDSAVGKSSLVLRFVRGQFFEYQESTIGNCSPRPSPFAPCRRGRSGGRRETGCPRGCPLHSSKRGLCRWLV